MSATDKSMPVPTWRVISNQPGQGKLPDGTYGSGHVVTVQLTKGSTGQLFVPDAIYHDVNAVREMVERKVMAIDAVDNLTSNS